MSSRRQLEKVEQALPPKEAAVAWMKGSHEFGSLLTYHRWLTQQPEETWPIPGLPRQAMTAARKRAQGRPPDEVATAAKTAERSVHLMVVLAVTMNVEAAREEERLRKEVLQLLAGLQLFTHEGSLMHERCREQILCQSTAPVVLDRQTTTSLAASAARITNGICELRTRAFVLDLVVKLLTERYFKGEDPLFPDLRSRLGLLLQVIAELGVTWHRLRSAYVETEADLRRHLVDEAAGKRHVRNTRVPASPAPTAGDAAVRDLAARAAENVVLLSKAETHRLLGEMGAARMLLERYLDRETAAQRVRVMPEQHPHRPTQRSPAPRQSTTAND